MQHENNICYNLRDFVFCLEGATTDCVLVKLPTEQHFSVKITAEVGIPSTGFKIVVLNISKPKTVKKCSQKKKFNIEIATKNKNFKKEFCNVTRLQALKNTYDFWIFAMGKNSVFFCCCNNNKTITFILITQNRANYR